MQEQVERITSPKRELAYLVRAGYRPAETTFLTPPEFKQQVGFIVYPKGGEVVRHRHVALERSLVGTAEAVLVLEGRCELDIYDEDSDEVFATRTLEQGDLVLLVAGGHGLRMIEDCVFLELKQGPYLGIDEKERF